MSTAQIFWKTSFSISLALVAVTNAFAGEKEIFEKFNSHEPHFHFRRGDVHQQSTRLKTNRALMSFHNGNVIHSGSTTAIFPGSQWTNASFVGDKISGIDSFFGGFLGSRYSTTGQEYSDLSGHVSGQAAYLGHVIDSSAAPSNAMSTSQAVAEACKITSNNPDPNGLYLIYTSTGAGNVNYCAWHSWGSCSNGARVQVAYMPNLDGIAGCDPGDSVTGHSQGLSALANVTSHELMETLTDPRGAGWYDFSGAENGDKCAWSFPSGNGISTFTNASQWMLQMEWSNAAYNAGTGLSNLSGQKGCIY